MRRMQTALMFWALLVGSVLVAAVQADAADLSPDLSLIGYDNRGVQQSPEGAQDQPCQSCPATVVGQSDSACQQAGSNAAGPMILNIGPPPRLYSPSADFGARIATAPGGWAVVGDDNAPPAALHHPTSTAPEPYPVYSSPQPVYSAPTPAMVSHLSWPLYRAGQPSPAFATTYPQPLPALPAPASNSVVVYPGIAPVAVVPSTFAYPPTPACAACPITGEADRLDHMLQAVHHLEAAGLQADADQLREECDAQIQQAVNHLKAAETELARLHRATVGAENTTARVNHPRQPVVTAALPTTRSADEHSYSVKRAAYFAPANSSAQPTNAFDGPALPKPFVPQSITIEPLKVFAEPGASWGIKPVPAPFTASPVMVDGWIFTPDKR